MRWCTAQRESRRWFAGRSNVDGREGADMSGAEMLLGLTAVTAAATPLALIWLTLRGTSPQQRRDLLPGLAEALRAVVRCQSTRGTAVNRPSHSDPDMNDAE
jgi:hypothetical protein